MGRVVGTRAFVAALDAAVPQAHLAAGSALRAWAEAQGLDAAEYFSERDVLEEQHKWWVPRLAAYSAIVAVHSLVEAELFACADRLRAGLKSPKRRGLDRARASFMRATAVDVTEDDTWPDMLRLEELRNIVVHRGGNVEQSDNDRKVVARLQKVYDSKLWLVKRSQLHGEYVHVTPTLCTEFAEKAEVLFRRLEAKIDHARQ